MGHFGRLPGVSPFMAVDGEVNGLNVSGTLLHWHATILKQFSSIWACQKVSNTLTILLAAHNQ